MFPQNLEYEKKLYDKGIRLVAGVDEVGRGALAGPFVVGAVIMDLDHLFEIFEMHVLEQMSENNINNDVMNSAGGVNEKPIVKEYKKYLGIKDSKLLTHNKRVELAELIKGSAKSYTIVEVASYELDDMGLAETTRFAFSKAISALSLKPEHVLTDKFPVYDLSTEKQTNIIRGDTKSITISAASILAKIHRDKIMTKLSVKYPMYNFEMNKGYGTKAHIEALNKVGCCPIHRKSYEPIKSMVNR